MENYKFRAAPHTLLLVAVLRTIMSTEIRPNRDIKHSSQVSSDMQSPLFQKLSNKILPRLKLIVLFLPCMVVSFSFFVEKIKIFPTWKINLSGKTIFPRKQQKRAAPILVSLVVFQSSSPAFLTHCVTLAKCKVGNNGVFKSCTFTVLQFTDLVT